MLKLRTSSSTVFGAALLVNGKTGQRRVRVIASAPLLSGWLNNHPFKENPDAPLWIVIGTRNHHEAVSYSTISIQLKKIAERAGVKKRVNSHAFRHARATHLANKLTEAQMKEFFGWVQSSDMASVYVHLSGRDVDDALLQLHGLAHGQREREELLRILICPRCQEKNSPVSKFCSRCGSPLDIHTAVELDEKRKIGDDIVSMLVKDPQVQEIILKKIFEDQTFKLKLKEML